jgi:hypothetical protein
VSQDTNGQMDVYEWERGGTGSCSSDNGGCIYLISTGRSSAPSYFGDSSADGRDVFFFTRQSLVNQDQDNNVDMYDARIEGGIVAQNPEPPMRPCSGEECRAALSVPPLLGTPSSAMFPAVGNLTPTPEVKGPATHSKKPNAKHRKKKERRKRKRVTRSARAHGARSGRHHS